MHAAGIQLSPHFTLEEFERSDTATRLGIDNTVPDELVPEAILTAEMAERIRAHLSALAGREIPMRISSGYRCIALNRALKSSDNGDHPKMAALDFSAPAFGSPLTICKALAPAVDQLGIGQLIHEFGQWVHVSRLRPAKPINRIITLSRAGAQVGIQEV